MLSVDLQSLDDFLILLSEYKNLAYPVLFLGAFFETLIPFSLVIYGELFFIAGAALAGIGTLDIWLVALVLYLGGILGDNSSYWLGRKYGMGLFEKLSTKPLTRNYINDRVLAKGVSFFRSKGKYAVFLARLSGPFSWFIPALAGSFEQPYKRFLLYNTPGVFIGIGEFLLLGYLFGNNLDTIMLWLSRLGFFPLTLSITLALGALCWYRSSGNRSRAHS